MLSHIRTVTVGYGIAPYLSDTGLADFHRRQGIAPAPEACLIIYLAERKSKQESVFKGNETVKKKKRFKTGKSSAKNAFVWYNMIL